MRQLIKCIAKIYPIEIAVSERFISTDFNWLIKKIYVTEHNTKLTFIYTNIIFDGSFIKFEV